MMLEEARTPEERRLALEGVLRTEREILRLMREERNELERQNANLERALELCRARRAAKDSLMKPFDKSPGAQ